MDCGKTEVFLKEWKRLCEKRSCAACPIKEIDMCVKRAQLWTEDGLKRLPEAIQKWSDEHPQETILEHFKKILPYMTVEIEDDRREVGSVCPYMLDRRISHRNCIGEEIEKYPCGDCWNRPYEEAIRGNEG